MELVVEVYRLLPQFPSVETYGLAAQLRRSSVSIPSNIAEGFRRESTREYLHYLSIAQGSLAEIETQIELARRLGYLNPADHAPVVALSSSVGKQLFSLRNALRLKIKPNPDP